MRLHERSLIVACLGLVGCTTTAPQPTQPTTAVASEPVPEQEPPPHVPEPTMRGLIATDDGGCVVRIGQGIWCWGGDLYGDLDVPLGIARRLELGESDPEAIASGYGNVCALFVAPGSDANLVRCMDQWATKTHKVLGDRGFALLDDQACVIGSAGLECKGRRETHFADAVDMATSDNRACVRTSSGELQCWTSYMGPDTATVEGSVPEAERLDMSGSRFCYLAAGQLHCSDKVQRGRQREFVAIPKLTDVVDFDIEGAHGCAIDGQGAVWCFGDNSFGQLGAGDTKHQDEPVQVPLPGPALEVAVAGGKSCALLEQQVLCWGSDGEGLHARRDRHRFELEADRLLVEQELSCARTPTGEWSCWGMPLGGVADELGGLVASAQPRRAKLDPGLEEIVYGVVRVGDERREAKISDELELIEDNVSARKGGISRIALDTVTACTLRKSGKLECLQDPPDLAWRRKFTLDDVDDFVVSDLDQFVCALRKGTVSCISEDRGWTRVPGMKSIVEIVLVEELHLCGRDRTGAVLCTEINPWNEYTGKELWSVPITDAVDLAGGYALYGLLIRSARGTLELVDVADRKPPEQLIASGVVELDAGAAHACVRVDEDGDGRSEAIECVGDNKYGSLGTLGDHVSLTPRAVEFPERFPIELPPIGTRKQP